jgi:hypothetical protein
MNPYEPPAPIEVEKKQGKPVKDTLLSILMVLVEAAVVITEVIGTVSIAVLIIFGWSFCRFYFFN